MTRIHGRFIFPIFGIRTVVSDFSSRELVDSVEHCGNIFNGWGEVVRCNEESQKLREALGWGRMPAENMEALVKRRYWVRWL